MTGTVAWPSEASSVLETLSAGIASIRAEQVAELPAPDFARGYQRVILYEDPNLKLAAARWVAGGESGVHGHADSAALYAVQRGRVEEQRYFPDGEGYRCEIVVLGPGDRSYLPPGSFHSVRALEDSVTLHAYSPAPESTTTPVPEPVQRMLQEARMKCARSGTRRAIGPQLSPATRPDLLTVIHRFLPAWAEREARANAEGQIRLPEQTVAELRSSGILSAPVPERLGGWGAALPQVVAAIRLVAQKAPSTALALSMPLGNAATTQIPELVVGRAQRPALRQGQQWIAEQCLAGRILAVANSEPGGGGDLTRTKTVARRGSDGAYHLTGRKSFATFGPDADYFLCAARRSAAGEHDGVVDGFFVARTAPGLMVDDRWNPVGMRPTASVGLTLDDAAADAVLGYPGCLEGINARHWSTALFAAVFLGIGEGALRQGLTQIPADAVWARATLAECALNLEAAAGFLQTVAREEAWPMPADLQERARRARTFVARVAVETATRAAMVAGGRCYSPDHPVFRFLCDALAGPLLRPPLTRAMDDVVRQLFPPAAEPLRVAA